MKRKLLLIFGLLMLVAGGYAAAAMVSVKADREVTATVADDLDEAAIKFTPLGEFKNQNVLVEGNDGTVSFDLDAVLRENVQGFNRDAEFSIGNEEEPVFSITNNLVGSEIYVGFKGNTSMKLYEATEKKLLTDTITVEISSGKSKEFYFVVDAEATDEDTLEGQLFIR